MVPYIIATPIMGIALGHIYVAMSFGGTVPLPAEVQVFIDNLRLNGPQVVRISDELFTCHTPIAQTPNWLLATTSSGCLVYRVNPWAAQAWPVDLANPPRGAILAANRCIPAAGLVASVTAACQSPGAVDDLASKTVLGHLLTGLVHPDIFTEELHGLLGQNGPPALARPIMIRLQEYGNDRADSARLRKACIDAVSLLAANATALGNPE